MKQSLGKVETKQCLKMLQAWFKTGWGNLHVARNSIRKHSTSCGEMGLVNTPVVRPAGLCCVLCYVLCCVIIRIIKQDRSPHICQQVGGWFLPTCNPFSLFPALKVLHTAMWLVRVQPVASSLLAPWFLICNCAPSLTHIQHPTDSVLS